MKQYHPIPHDELQFNAIACNAALYHLIPYNAMHYHAKQYYTLQYHAIACHTVEFILIRRIRDEYYSQFVVDTSSFSIVTSHRQKT